MVKYNLDYSRHFYRGYDESIVSEKISLEFK